MYSHEFKMAVLEALQSQPEVQQVSYLLFWEEHLFFVVLHPRSPEVETRVEAAVRGTLPPQAGVHQFRLSFFQKGELLPSSATLYRRTPIAVGVASP